MADFPTKYFAERLRDLRNKRYGKYGGNIKLAEDLKISPKVLSNFTQEENPREPSLELIYGLALLREDINLLLTGESLNKNTYTVNEKSEPIYSNAENHGTSIITKNNSKTNYNTSGQSIEKKYIEALETINKLQIKITDLEIENNSLKRRRRK